MVDDLVLIDTDVWSGVVPEARHRDARIASWRRLLLGKHPVVAAQTEGEIRFGALARRWGDDRLARLELDLVRTPTVPVTGDVIKAFASVRADCKARGHQLAEKHHMGDAWIAATAHAYELPLLSGDGIYEDIAGIQLLKEVDD